eukprot:3732293-Prymnesium_polylepis.1
MGHDGTLLADPVPAVDLDMANIEQQVAAVCRTQRFKHRSVGSASDESDSTGFESWQHTRVRGALAGELVSHA